MPMARTGLYYAVKSVLGPKKKVILSPYTIADVVNMVICAGGIPVFADLSPHGCNVSAHALEKLIDEDTGAVLVTHFYGEACDIERISAFCKARHIPLIEDGAMAFGVTVNGQPVGTFGDIGVFSFGLYKNVNSYYGGMVVTQDDSIAERIRNLTSGRSPERLMRYLPKVFQGLVVDLITWPLMFRLFSFYILRFAYLRDITSITSFFKIDVDPKIKREIPKEYLHAMTPLQARLILKQLPGVESGIKKRILHAKLYHEGLSGIPQIVRPPLKTDGSHGYYYYCIHYKDRSALVRYAKKNNCDIQESYHRNCADLPCFSDYKRICPNAYLASEEVIYLPTYPNYPRHEIERTISVIKSFFHEPKL
jgi:dTDP-4-amino-4,6-dideoxygalactose transaminase